MEPSKVVRYDENAQILNISQVRNLTDLETGEVVPVLEKRSVLYGSELFNKTYRKLWQSAYDHADSAYSKVLFYFFLNLRYRKGTVYAPIDTIVEETGYSRASVFKALAKIQEADIFVKCQPGVWMANPACISGVSDFQRAKMAQMYWALKERERLKDD